MSGAGNALDRRRYLAHALLVTAILLCSTLAFWSPTRNIFYPQCPVHHYFGVLCPGCGATRALSALLHGHLIDALKLNAFFVLLLPAVLAGTFESYRRALRPGPFRWPQPPVSVLYAILVTATIFAVGRNLV